jgi:hypothetical protein
MSDIKLKVLSRMRIEVYAEFKIHISAFSVKTLRISEEHSASIFKALLNLLLFFFLNIPHFVCKKEGTLSVSNSKMLKKIIRQRGEEVEGMEKKLYEWLFNLKICFIFYSH